MVEHTLSNAQAIAASTVEWLRKNLDKCRQLEPGALHASVHRIVAMIVQSLFETKYTECEIENALVRPALNDGISRTLLRAICKATASQTWAALSDRANEAEKELLVKGAAAFFSGSHHIQDAINRGERKAQSGAEDSSVRRRELTLALLRGERPDAGGMNSATYAVIVVGKHPCVAGDASVADHIRHVHEKTGADWLVVEQQDVVVLLVPDGSPHPATAHAGPTAAAQAAFDALRIPLVAGYVLPEMLTDIPAAVREARETVATVAALGRVRPGLYRLDDLLIEAMLLRSRDLAHRLATKVAPVVDLGEQVVETLEAFLESDCERRELARRLYIHPNTLNYRLRRVQELTGLSVSSPRDLGILKTALVALRITGTRTGMAPAGHAVEVRQSNVG
ncbi:helix-turn-helix domain-containing protein [Actinocrispum sp. NPDC049592]|uniref:PucR family transcriptional regulator n=1 Tax=Actinocrispum sp. NPDC049592 TaxID=3154835 RepID=UPI003414158A